MEKININLTEIEFKDLNGTMVTVQNFVKDLANEIYRFPQRTIQISAISKTLFNGETAEVEKDDLVDLIAIVNALNWTQWIKEHVIEYLNDKLKENGTNT